MTGTLLNNVIYENENAVVEFKFDNIPSNAKVVKIPQAAHLQITGPEQAQHTQIIYGNVSRSFHLRFFVAASGPG